MTLFFHEMKKNRLSLLIWSLVIAFMLCVSIMIYPEMEGQMSEMSDMFADMGSFTAAFGMDKLNFGEFMGYFGIECGNVLGLGGALFAALAGISALAKEEKDRTAEFLLSHPISRIKITLQKLLSVFCQIVLLNLVVVCAAVLCITVIDVELDVGNIALIFLSYLLLQLEIGMITFGISAFLKGNGLGIGLGLAMLFYFANIISNLTEEAKFLKYITPFGYADSAQIISDNSLKWEYLVVGMAIGAVCLIIGFGKYNKKDIA